MPVEDMSAVVTFLSNTSLNFFAFLIAKIATQGQQLCQPSCKYFFLLSNHKNCKKGAADVLVQLQLRS